MSDAIEETRAALERSVREAGYAITGDGRVSECVAAQLVGVSVRHLRRLRSHGEIAGHRLGVGSGSRVSYRLSALAAVIASTNDDANWPEVATTGHQ
jgi:hypothetical protein